MQCTTELRLIDNQTFEEITCLSFLPVLRCDIYRLDLAFVDLLETQLRIRLMEKEETKWLSHIHVRLKSQGHVKKIAYRCSKLNAYCLLSCRNNSTLISCLYRPTVTLHQGQGHEHDHEHIYQA